MSVAEASNLWADEDRHIIALIRAELRAYKPDLARATGSLSPTRYPTPTGGAPGGYTPAVHASSHESGGSDPLALGSIAGTLTDGQHGSRGGGSLHAVATTGAAGFMSATDKSTLDGIAVLTTRGDLLTRNATVHTRLAIGASGRYLRSDGTDPSWHTLDFGDLVYSGLTTGQVLRATGASAAAFGQLDLANSSAVTGALPIANGGTGQITAAAAFDALSPTTTRGDLVYRNATTNTRLAIGTSGKYLRSDGTDPSWSQLDMGDAAAGTLAVARGGTGLASYTTGDLLYASGATALSKLVGVATGNALISGGVGTAPSWGKIGLTTHVSGVLGLANGGTNADLSTTGGTGQYLKQASAGAAVTVGTIPYGDLTYSGLTTGQVLRATGASAAAFGALDLANSNAVTGVLSAANGGTGVNNSTRTLTVNSNAGTLDFTAASKTLSIGQSLTLTGTSGKTLTLTNGLTVSGNDGTLSFSAASSTLTIPATGTTALLGTAQTFSENNTFQKIVRVPMTASGNGYGIRLWDGTTEYGNWQALDLGGASYIFFSTNRQYDGSAWQTLNSRAGASLQISADNTFAFNTFPAASTTATQVFGISSSGATLIGRTSGLSGAGDLDANGNGRVGGTLAVGSTSLSAANTLHLSSGTNVALRIDGSGNTATTASAGAQTLPANPVGFLIVSIAGTNRKIPYYAT